jgi:large subunit ribosomal protein L29
MPEKKLAKRLEELHSFSNDDLNGAILTAQKAMYQVRRDRLSKPIENPKVTKTAKKEIARIKTIQRQREIAAGK